MKLYFFLVGLCWVLGLFSYPNSFQSSSSLDSDEEFTKGLLNSNIPTQTDSGKEISSFAKDIPVLGDASC